MYTSRAEPNLLVLAQPVQSSLGLEQVLGRGLIRVITLVSWIFLDQLIVYALMVCQI